MDNLYSSHDVLSDVIQSKNHYTAPSNVHSVSLSDFYAHYFTSPIGISDYEARVRQKKYGLNQFTEEPKAPVYIRFLLQFRNMFSVLLLIGAVLSFIGEEMAPGEGSIYVAYALLGVTVLNAIFTFFQEYKAEKAMEAFKNMLPQKITVIRNRIEKEILAKDLVPGDVIVLNEGDKIPADARVIEENLLKVDHSALTGESEPQLRSVECTHKDIMKTRNIVFSGTLVQSGSGKAVVYAIGDNTEMGKIAKMTHTVKEEKSKIRKELSHFVKVISSIAIALGIIFFFLGILKGNTFWANLVFAIGIIVANVPEGLLPTVTLTLAIAAKKMAKKKALVKDIESIETLGSITTICTDKTGTLTQNTLNVENIYLNNTFYEPYKMFLISNNKRKEAKDVYGFDKLVNIMLLCNNAHHIVKKHKLKGDPTEVALLMYSERFEDVSIVRHENPRQFEIPFDSEKKYMITAHRVDDLFFGFMKGAPEKVIEKCTHIEKNGKIVKLTPKLKREILKANDKNANDGLRVLAFAYKRLPKKIKYEHVLDKNDYVFLGMVSLSDPLRPEVPASVMLAKEAGIKIIVISGDHPKTVAAIARKAGIAKKPIMLTSDDIRKLSDSKLKKKLRENEVIIARALPKDKLRVVHLLQQMGEIVAVTGDGVNDAPALKKADVGVAMGKTGTEVAKEASNIVLLDDNFSTIIKAVEEGRTIYDNIKSFIIYILTSNTPEIVPFLLFVLLGWPLALPALLILAIDLGTDMLPAISLGMENPENDVMKQKPRNPKAKLLTWKMIARSYGFIGPFQTLVAYIMFFAVLFAGEWTFGMPISIHNPLYLSAVSAFFASIVITQVFNLISSRTIRTSTFKKPFKNRMMLIGIFVELFLLYLIIYNPLFQKLFGTRPFPLYLITYMILGGILLLALEETRKYLYRKYGWFEVS